jgi:serine/threonine-protein kinase
MAEVTQVMKSRVNKANDQSTRWSKYTLNSQTIGAALDRVQAVCLIMVIAGVAATAAIDLPPLVFGDDPFRLLPRHVVLALMMAASALLYAAIRGDKLPVAQEVKLALAYQVLIAMGLAVNSASRFYGEGQVMLWPLCIWIVTYSLIVPANPRLGGIATVLSAVCQPVAFVLWPLATTAEIAAPAMLGQLVGPALICAGIGIYCSRVVYRMGTEIDRLQRMGSYHLKDLIGVGGMGEVWRAEHEMLARPAAIKLIKAEALGDGDVGQMALRRFEREAQVTASLTSPHTIQIFDFGVTGDGAFYYVMEMLDGVDLESLVKRDGPLPAARVNHYLHHAAKSLAEAHIAGLCQRDIKPANLFACGIGTESDFLKVLDFGLVTAETTEHDQYSDDLQTLDQFQGQIAGTPTYMAPEVALSKGSDARSDVYALGCVMYFLLTGKCVFRGSTVMETLFKHTRDPVPPLSEHGITDVPSDLQDVMMACLEKDPGDRPQNAGELLARLPRDSWSAPAT